MTSRVIMDFATKRDHSGSNSFSSWSELKHRTHSTCHTVSGGTPKAECTAFSSFPCRISFLFFVNCKNYSFGSISLVF